MVPLTIPTARYSSVRSFSEYQSIEAKSCAMATTYTKSKERSPTLKISQTSLQLQSWLPLSSSSSARQMSSTSSSSSSSGASSSPFSSHRQHWLCNARALAAGLMTGAGWLRREGLGPWLSKWLMHSVLHYLLMSGEWWIRRDLEGAGRGRSLKNCCCTLYCATYRLSRCQYKAKQKKNKTTQAVPNTSEDELEQPRRVVAALRFPPPANFAWEGQRAHMHARAHTERLRGLHEPRAAMQRLRVPKPSVSLKETLQDRLGRAKGESRDSSSGVRA